ncbi:unnamed protein product, partial [Meganyctiphanes norvegica]
MRLWTWLRPFFCDDGLFWATGKYLHIARDKIRRALACLTAWCKETGFKFSVPKTYYIVFTRKRVRRDPVMFLCGSPITRQYHTKYLGMTFDSSLTWRLHILDLVERCKKPLALMRMIAGKRWGGDRQSLTLLYTSLIRSKIDYGSFLYATAADCHLIKVNRIQYAAIRIITGLMRCTPVGNLEAEANILPLHLRRDQLMLQYFGRVLRLENHPVTHLFNNFYNFAFYSSRPYALPVVGRAKELLTSSNMPLDNLEQIPLADLHFIGVPAVRYNLLANKKHFTNIQFRLQFHSLQDTLYSDYVPVFTDGSKMDGRTSFAFVVLDTVVAHRLPSSSSIFTAELYAIYRAVKHISLSDWVRVVIFSDSLSALQAIDSFSPKSHYMLKLQKLLALCDKEIVLEWVPAHVGIHGNDLADAAAKAAIQDDVVISIKLLYSDLRVLIRHFIFQCWQTNWSLSRCWLRRLKPILGDWKSAYRECRREEIVLSRLRAGTCLFMVQHRFDTSIPRDLCPSCDVYTNVFHILVRCPRLTVHRTGILAHLSANNLSQSVNNILGDDFPFSVLFTFLRNVAYFNRV